MENIDEYYKKTMRNGPSKLLENFWNMGLNEKISDKTAIDLGCGAGNDVLYLLHNQYQVTAVDKEGKVVDIVTKRISDSSKLRFIIEDFEKVKLPKADLMLANLSVFFCKPEYFKHFMEEVKKNIKAQGYFVRKFFRKR